MAHRWTTGAKSRPVRFINRVLDRAKHFSCAHLLAAGLFIFTAAHNKSLSLSNEQVGGQSDDFTISIHSFKSRAPGQPIKTHLVRPAHQLAAGMAAQNESNEQSAGGCVAA